MLQLPENRIFCKQCNCIVPPSEVENEKHKMHLIRKGLTNDLIVSPSSLFEPLSQDDKEAQYFFDDLTLQCIVNNFKELKFKYISFVRVVFK